MEYRDELGFRVELDHPPVRVVSLVPSITETLFALGLDDEIVGVTKFCIAPEEKVAGLLKVGGTKNPDLRMMVELAPDLVVVKHRATLSCYCHGRSRGNAVSRCASPARPLCRIYPPGAL